MKQKSNFKDSTSENESPAPRDLTIEPEKHSFQLENKYIMKESSGASENNQIPTNNNELFVKDKNTENMVKEIENKIRLELQETLKTQQIQAEKLLL